MTWNENEPIEFGVCFVRVKYLLTLAMVRSHGLGDNWNVYWCPVSVAFRYCVVRDLQSNFNQISFNKEKSLL